MWSSRLPGYYWLNTLQCPGQPPTKNPPAPNAHSAEADSPVSHSPGAPSGHSDVLESFSRKLRRAAPQGRFVAARRGCLVGRGLCPGPDGHGLIQSHPAIRGQNRTRGGTRAPAPAPACALPRGHQDRLLPRQEHALAPRTCDTTCGERQLFLGLVATRQGRRAGQGSAAKFIGTI